MFSVLLLWLVLLVAHKYKLYDSLGARKLHTQSIPRLGGIAFIPALHLGIVVAMVVYPDIFSQLYAHIIESTPEAIYYPLVAIVGLYILGFVDDIWEIGASTKFLGQALSALLVCLGGYEVDNLQGILTLEELAPVFSFPLTCLVFMLIINATNLIDGVDGLSSGLCISAFALYSYFFYQSNSYGYQLLSFAGIAALLPFMFLNIFGNADKKTKIFMGDTGALSLGLLLCILAGGAFKQVDSGFMCGTNRLIAAFSPLYLPAFDVVRVFIDRIRRGVSPFTAEKNHIHHYFIACGMTHRQTTISLMLISFLLAVVMCFLSCYVEPTLLLLGGYASWHLFGSYMKRLLRCKQGQ